MVIRAFMMKSFISKTDSSAWQVSDKWPLINMDKQEIDILRYMKTTGMYDIISFLFAIFI